MKKCYFNKTSIYWLALIVAFFVILISILSPNVESFQSIQSDMLSFAPVPDLSTLGYKATGLGDAFADDIEDVEVLNLADLEKNQMFNTTNEPNFVELCASNCSKMNEESRNCDGFVLEYDSSNERKPINSCWLKKRKSVLTYANDRIAYFLED